MAPAVNACFLAFLLAVAGCSGSPTLLSGPGTFVVQVIDERFRVRIDDPALAAEARLILRGKLRQKVVAGFLVRGDGGFNAPWSWHMDPATVALADVTIELCDGRPSGVEANLDYWVDTVKQFCPWDGRVVAEVGK